MQRLVMLTYLVFFLNVVTSCVDIFDILLNQYQHPTFHIMLTNICSNLSASSLPFLPLCLLYHLCRRSALADQFTFENVSLVACIDS